MIEVDELDEFLKLVHPVHKIHIIENKTTHEIGKKTKATKNNETTTTTEEYIPTINTIIFSTHLTETTIIEENKLDMNIKTQIIESENKTTPSNDKQITNPIKIDSMITQSKI